MSDYNTTIGAQSPYHRLANPRILPISNYKPGKPIAEVKREYGLDSIVKLASNENPAGPSPLALLALEEALREINYYPEDGGIELKRGLADKCGISSNNIILGHGATEVLDIIVRAFVCPGDEVISAHPSFPWFQMLGQMSGAKNVIVPLREYTHDLKAMADSITPETKLIFIANPNNPTGTFVEPDAMHAFLGRVPATVIVVLDEAYQEYLPASLQADTIAWLAEFPNLVVTRTFSKIYGLAALRVGYGVGPADVVAAIRKVQRAFDVTTPAQEAALASLDGADELARRRAVNREAMAALEAVLRTHGFDPIGPAAGNFLFVDVGTDADALNDALLRRGVIVRPMGSFGAPTALRISAGTPEEIAFLGEQLASVFATT